MGTRRIGSIRPNPWSAVLAGGRLRSPTMGDRKPPSGSYVMIVPPFEKKELAKRGKIPEPGTLLNRVWFWPTFRDGNESFWALCGGAEITRICVISGGCVGWLACQVTV